VIEEMLICMILVEEAVLLQEPKEVLCHVNSVATIAGFSLILRQEDIDRTA
jgi:hypothetical protein